MDWFPWYPALYRADTLDLTLEQDGAYRRLIDHYMETRLPLPDNNNALARIIGISVNDFQAIAEQVRRKFIAKAGFLHNKRCDIELNRQDSLSKKRSNVARAAHDKRNKTNDFQAIAEKKPSNCTDTGQDKTGQDSSKKDLEHASPDGEVIWFNDFWVVYPKKVAKGGALKAYKSAIKRGATHEQIRSGAERYAASCRQARTEKQFTKNPATWLNQDCWLDEDGPPSGNRGNGQRASVIDAALAAMGSRTDER